EKLGEPTASTLTECLVVVETGITLAYLKLGRSAKRQTCLMCNALHPLVGLDAPGLIQGAKGALEPDFVGNHVGRTAGSLDLSKTEDGGNKGIGFATDELLERHHDLC